MRAVTAERLTGFIVGFGAVGITLTGWLVLSELLREPTCPGLLGMPACYILLGAYVAATCGAWFIETRAGGALFLAGGSPSW
jgi:hypothetical protein